MLMRVYNFNNTLLLPEDARWISSEILDIYFLVFK